MTITREYVEGIDAANQNNLTFAATGTNIADGSLIVFAIYLEDGAAFTGSPTGYSEVARVPITGGGFSWDLIVGVMKRSGTLPSLRFDMAASHYIGGVVRSYTNPAAGTAPSCVNVVGADNSGTGTTATATGATTTLSNCMVVAAIARDTAGTASTPASMTIGLVQTVDGGCAYWDVLQTAAGASGNKVSTLNNSTRWAAAVIALAGDTSSSGSSTISPAALDDGGVVPSPLVSQRASPASIDDGGLVQSPRVDQRVSPAALDDGGLVQSPRLDQRLTTPAVDDGGLVQSPRIDQRLSPSSIDDGGLVQAPVVTTLAAFDLIEPASVDDGGLVQSPTVSQRIFPSSVNDGNQVGSPVLAQVISPSSIDDGGLVGTPAVGATGNPGMIGFRTFGFPRGFLRRARPYEQRALRVAGRGAKE